MLNFRAPTTSQRPTSPRAQPNASAQMAGAAALARLEGPKPGDKRLAAAKAQGRSMHPQARDQPLLVLNQ